MSIPEWDVTNGPFVYNYIGYSDPYTGDQNAYTNSVWDYARWAYQTVTLEGTSRQVRPIFPRKADGSARG